MRKLYWIAIAIFLFISACTKIESTTIGSGLIPPIDGVNTFDTTLDVITNNFYDSLRDSLKVYKSDDHVIGTINDNIFGKTTAKAIFELKPTFYPFTFSATNTAVADSAVLILSYKGVYGDTTVSQQWEVLELADSMESTKAYSVSKSFTTKGSLGEKTIDIRTFNDSVNYGFEQATNQIRIKLSSSFAQRLIESYKTAEYQTDTTFRQSFKGFVVQPKSNSLGNALIRINLLDTNTKLALFYNYKLADTSTSRSSAVNYFRFSAGSTSTFSGSANNITRSYAGSQIQSFVRTNNDSVVFIQTAPGTFATVKIPGLRNLPNLIIHRAELLTFQAPDDLSNILTPPRFLWLSGYDSTKKVNVNIRNDFTISSTAGTNNFTTFGGYLSQKNVPGVNIVYAYTFDLTRYTQGIVTRKDSSMTLRLSAPSNDSLLYSEPYPSTLAPVTAYMVPSIANNVAEGRVRLGGGGMAKSAPLRMRLRIIYSRL